MAATIKFWRKLFDQGVEKFNAYRQQHPKARPNLRGEVFQFLDCRNIDLTGADLRETNWFCVDLSRAKLQKADLRGTQMLFCDLSRSSLSGAKCSKAIFDRLSFFSAELNDVDFKHSHLSSIEFSEASNLRGMDLRQASYCFHDFVMPFSNLDLSASIKKEIRTWYKRNLAREHFMDYETADIKKAPQNCTESQCWLMIAGALRIKITLK